MDTMLICRQCRAPLPAHSLSNLCAACQRDGSRTPPPSPASRDVSAPEPAEIARRFPQLEILELVAIGGMGMVYKARQPQLDRLVALKVLSPELSRDPAFADRFAREAKALARLNHSNIVSVYDFGKTDDYYYFLMEYVEGVTLHHLIRETEMTPGEARRIVVEICQALQYAHEEGIVHRDIKPPNILVDKKGRVKIADFGLAKLWKGMDASRPQLTQPAFVMGTPNYMAPEQMEKPLEVDHRADLYAVGVVFYEMLTHELPIGRFEAPSRRAAVDARLDRVVLRALEKEPKRRFQSATEIRLALESLEKQKIAAPTSDGEHTRARWGWLKQLALMTGSAVLAVGLYWGLRSHLPAHSGRIPPETVTALEGAPEEGPPTLRLFRPLKLSPAQALAVNRIVRRGEQEFTRAERQHTARTRDDKGHVHVTISPFPDQMQTLMTDLWSGLAATLTAGQLARARTLPLDRLFPHSGTNTVKVELWQDANGDYHYAEDEQAGGKDEGKKGRPEFPMPRRFRSLLDATPPSP